MTAEVVELGVADIKALMKLEALCFDYNWSEEQFELGLIRNAYKVLGIYDSDQLIGYIAFSLIIDEMEILNLAVHPKYRRLGLGKLLLGKAFKMCRDNGIKKSFLDVKITNVAAQNLYKSFGYHQIGVRKKYYPDTKEDALLYRYDFKN